MFLAVLGKRRVENCCKGRASVITTKTWTFQHNAQLLSPIFRIKVNRFQGAQNQNYVVEETSLWLKVKDFFIMYKDVKKDQSKGDSPN